MSIETVDVDNIDYDFYSGLRSYHVYQKIWKPFISQVKQFTQEEKSPYDSFAISGSAKICKKNRSRIGRTYSVKIK